MTERSVTWQELFAETTDRVGSRAEARWLIERAVGSEPDEWLTILREPATERAVGRLDAMVAERLAGVPIQYVLGAWAFRTLDVMVDRRVLIPRPETEQVVEAALTAARERLAGGHRPVRIVDLGTGSGVIALSMAAELPVDAVEVWGTEISPDALDVARANLAGIAGRAARHVRLLEGSWFEPLPAELQGTIDVVVANPPYIGAGEALDPTVADHEPHIALVSGPSGFEAIEHVVSGALQWLAPGGALVCEIGSSQRDGTLMIAVEAGYRADVLTDLAGLDRILVATRR